MYRTKLSEVKIKNVNMAVFVTSSIASSEYWNSR